MNARRARIAVGASLVLVFAGVGVDAWFAEPEAAETSEQASPSAGSEPLDAVFVDASQPALAVSPDGTRVVFGATAADGARNLRLKMIGKTGSTLLADLGTDPRAPFFSPDGEWIGYLAEANELRKVAVGGGAPVALCTVAGFLRGATWGPDDTIVFATSAPQTGLWRVSSQGGQPEPLTTPSAERDQRGHWWPEFLPDGKAILFTSVSSGPIASSQVAVVTLETGATMPVVEGATFPKYLPSGHLVYSAGHEVKAIGFDVETLRTTTTAVTVVDNVPTKGTGASDFGVSAAGPLVYVLGNASDAPPGRTLAWLDRSGAEVPLGVPERAYFAPKLSPDGTRMALSIETSDGADIWVYDIAAAAFTQLTDGSASDQAPVWTQDGRRVVFASNRGDGPFNLFVTAVDGSGDVERLTSGAVNQFPTATSETGQAVFVQQSPDTGWDIAAVSLADKAVRLLVAEPGNQLEPTLSPDGRWLAYQSFVKGWWHVYVRPFPDVERGSWEVSPGGGMIPEWASDGRELVYVTADGRVMSVAIQASDDIESGPPTLLFATDRLSASGVRGRHYDVAPDGQRFLIMLPGVPPTLHIVPDGVGDLVSRLASP